MERREFLTASSLSLAGLYAVPSSLMAADVEMPGKTKFSSYAVNLEMWWGKLPFLKRMEEAAKLGFSSFEMWDPKGKDLPAVADLAGKLKLKPVQFTAWGFSPGMNNPANKQKFVDSVGKSCEIAKTLGCTMMCVVAGNDIPGKSQEEMHDTVIEALKAGAPIAEKAGVTMILEAMNIKVDHKGHCLYGAKPSIKIVKAVDSKAVKLLWDIYHMYITDGDQIPRIKEGHEYTAYYQLADHPDRAQPGTGEMDYPKIIKLLRDLGYKGEIGLECRPKGSELKAAQAVYEMDLKSAE